MLGSKSRKKIAELEKEKRELISEINRASREFRKLANYENRDIIEELLEAKDRANKAERDLVAARDQFMRRAKQEALEIFGFDKSFI